MSERNLSFLLLEIKVLIEKIPEYIAEMNFSSYEVNSRTKACGKDNIYDY